MSFVKPLLVMLLAASLLIGTWGLGYHQASESARAAAHEISYYNYHRGLFDGCIALFRILAPWSSPDQVRGGCNGAVAGAERNHANWHDMGVQPAMTWPPVYPEKE